jgi:hypothetical protein
VGGRESAIADEPPTDAGATPDDRFRPDIEGLRAVAVLAVVLFHAGVPGLPGGIMLDMARRYTPDYGFTVYDRAWLDSLTRTVTRLRSTGARVLVMGPVPDPLTVVPSCLSEHLESAVECAPKRAAAVNGAGIAAETRATAAAGGMYANLTQLFCTTTRCPDIVGNQLVYRDDNHLTIEYARWLAPVVGAELDRLLATA